MTSRYHSVIRAALHAVLSDRDAVYEASQSERRMNDLEDRLLASVATALEPYRMPAAAQMDERMHRAFVAFTSAMGARLVAKSKEGFSGWDNADRFPMANLRHALRRSRKPVDIANFAMFAFARGTTEFLPWDQIDKNLAAETQPVITVSIASDADPMDVAKYFTALSESLKAPLSPPDVQERAMALFEAATEITGTTETTFDPRVQVLLDVAEHGLDTVIERTIIRAFLEHVIEKGFVVSVNDDMESSGEFVLYDSSDVEAILAVMFTTEGDTLFIRPVAPVQKGMRWHGWVSFVYGNGTDVLHDHSAKVSPYPDHPAMSDLVEPILKLAERLDTRS